MARKRKSTALPTRSSKRLRIETDNENEITSAPSRSPTPQPEPTNPRRKISKSTAPKQTDSRPEVYQRHSVSPSRFSDQITEQVQIHEPPLKKPTVTENVPTGRSRNIIVASRDIPIQENLIVDNYPHNYQTDTSSSLSNHGNHNTGNSRYQTSNDLLSSKTAGPLLPICKDESDILDFIEQAKDFNSRVSDKKNFLSIAKSKIQGNVRHLIRFEINEANSLEQLIKILSDEFLHTADIDEAYKKIRNIVQSQTEKVRQFGSRVMQNLSCVHEIIKSNSLPSNLNGELNRATQDAISGFINGLREQSIKNLLNHARPKTLRDAIREAAQIEVGLPENNSTPQSSTVKAETQQPAYLATVNAIKTEQITNPNFTGCYKCKGMDHVKRNCPKNSPKSTRGRNNRNRGRRGNNNSRGGYNNVNGNNNRTECYYCHNFGHKETDCYKRMRDVLQKLQQTRNNPNNNFNNNNTNQQSFSQNNNQSLNWNGAPRPRQFNNTRGAMNNSHTHRNVLVANASATD